ncbi:transposase [uncultured Methanobrevibacter sp.]|uniref:transposase n=1 Tax=uncultured Methanobrevibacter sp. TaxID=253161 RepID=UPI0025E855CC|nr:transposase [uncultured Methanobrevibacter sp.]
MVLRDDTINQQLLILLDLRDLIPKDHPHYFIKNVVDTMDFTEVHKKFEGKPGESAYSRAMLLRVTLMGAFDGVLSSRDLEEQVNRNIAYMYLAGMLKPDFRTFARFKEQKRD